MLFIIFLTLETELVSMIRNKMIACYIHRKDNLTPSTEKKPTRPVDLQPECRINHWDKPRQSSTKSAWCQLTGILLHHSTEAKHPTIVCVSSYTSQWPHSVHTVSTYKLDSLTILSDSQFHLSHSSTKEHSTPLNTRLVDLQPKMKPAT